MVSIKNIMTHDHKRCDDYFAQAENFAMAKDWNNTVLMTNTFHQALQLHLKQEEEKLFPAFENATGMHQGPTMVMRSEHQQIRELLEQLLRAAEDKNSDRYFGLSETLHIFMQQHNMKEEQILYPMIDQECSNDAEKLLSGFVTDHADVA
ncbi:MAG: hemerythrin domain-containing protein [Gammaproteobacteria bacterium]|nr:hemerythrin domain-containing protein [Gammaproteobacteria bacterium]